MGLVLWVLSGFCVLLQCFMKYSGIMNHVIAASDCISAFCHAFMMTSSNRNIFRVTGPLWGETTGGFPSQRPVTENLFSVICAWINAWTNNRERICSWSSADRQCSNYKHTHTYIYIYIWVINNFTALKCSAYIRCLTVDRLIATFLHVFHGYLGVNGCKHMGSFSNMINFISE